MAISSRIQTTLFSSVIPDSKNTDGHLTQLGMLIGPFVPPVLRSPEGGLNLGMLRNRMGSADELQDFIADQARLNDHFSLRSPYADLLRNSEYSELFRFLYLTLRDQNIPAHLRTILPALIGKLEAALIVIDAESFVDRYIATQEGQTELQRILKGMSSPYSPYSDKTVQAEFVKAIAAASQEMMDAHAVRTVTRHISLYNWWNIAVTDTELTRAKTAATNLLAALGNRYTELDTQRNYREHRFSDSSLALFGKMGIAPSTYHRIQSASTIDRDQSDSRSMLLAHLARVCLFAADARNWISFHGNTLPLRRYLLTQGISFFERCDSLSATDEHGLLNLIQALREFLHKPIQWNETGTAISPSAWDWMAHYAVGTGLQSALSPLVAPIRAPFDELLQLADDYHHAHEMGEAIVGRAHALTYPDERLHHLLKQLEALKRGFWYQYKQRTLLSRTLSSLAEKVGAGDVTDIRRAVHWIDTMIADLVTQSQQLTSRAESDKLLHEISTRIVTALRCDQVLYRAIDAAELDGSEALLGLSQTLILISATGATTLRVAQVLRSSRFALQLRSSPQFAHVAKRFAPFAEQRIGRHLTRMANTALLSGTVSIEDNILASVTGQWTPGDPAWLRQASLTGLTTSVVGLLPLSHEMGALSKRLLSRYATRSIWKGLGTYGLDTGTEVAQELSEEILGHWLNELERLGLSGVVAGDAKAIRKAQLRETAIISAFGGLHTGAFAEVSSIKSHPKAPPPSSPATPALPGSVPTDPPRSSAPQRFRTPAEPAAAKPKETQNLPWVGVLNPNKIPEPLRRVRTLGIRDPADLAAAKEYLKTLHPGFHALVQAAESQGIPVQIGEKDLTFSYARPTFNGRVDRTVFAFGESITIHRGAAPDVYLHEIVHALPLTVVREILHTHFGITIALEFPSIDPTLHFSELRDRILQHTRLNETLSFGVQCLSFDLEQQRGWVPVFHEPMMRELSSAWGYGQFGGILHTFPYCLPHYEETEGRNSIQLALIVKVEGRTTLTWDEHNRLLSVNDGQVTLKDYATYFQAYLNRYVQARQLNLPEDFYSLEAILKRQNPMAMGLLLSDTANWVAQNIETLFFTLEQFEAAPARETAPITARPLTAGDIPPASSQAARTAVFAGFTGVMDRLLDNPPTSFSRTELAAMVSYARLVPGALAIDLAERLRVYLGPDYRDLQITLGLILYEKGLPTIGKKLFLEAVTLDLLAESLPLVLQVMGHDAPIQAVLEREHGSLTRSQHRLAYALGTRAYDQFIWPDDDCQALIKRLLSEPAWTTGRGWQRFGRWLSEQEDMDYTVDKRELFFMVNRFMVDHFSESARFYRDLEEYRRRRLTFAGLIASLRDSPQVSAGTREFVHSHWDSMVQEESEKLAAVAGLIHRFQDPFPLRYLHKRNALGLYPDAVISSLFAAYPRELRNTALVYAQCHRHRQPWIDRAAVTRALKKLHASLQAESASDSQVGGVFVALPQLFRAILMKPDHPAVLASASFTREIQAVFDTLCNGDSPPRAKNARVTPSPTYKALSKRIGISEFKINELYKDLPKAAKSSIDQLIWLTWAMELDPARAPQYLDRALQVERILFGYDQAKTLKVDLNTEHAHHSPADIRENYLLPLGLYFIHQALRLHQPDSAHRFHHFLFGEVAGSLRVDLQMREAFLARYPASTSITSIMAVRGTQEKFAGMQWTFGLAADRYHAVQGRSLGAWMKRLQEEIYRGSGRISFTCLNYFAHLFIEEGRWDILPDLYRLMMVQSINHPQQATMIHVIRAIQDSPLSDDVKDELLYQYVSRLIDLADVTQGIDLNYLQELQHLFPWRTPFMAAGDLPCYPRTEELIIAKLAAIPELIQAERGKDDRLRLAIFAAAGLPLQRYSRWHEQGRSPLPGQDALHRRAQYRPHYQHLDLPHPYTIPPSYPPQEVETLLAQKGECIAQVLEGSDPLPAEAACLLLGRILGSELRALENDREIADPSSSQSRVVPLSRAKSAIFIGAWLKKEADKAASTRSPHWERVVALYLAAGPNTVRRLDEVCLMMDWPLARLEKQQLFDQATQHLFFSPRVRSRLAQLRSEATETNEIAYYRFLCHIHYEHHPRRMISDYLLNALERDPALFKEYERYVARSGPTHPLLFSDLLVSSTDSNWVRAIDSFTPSIADRFGWYVNAIGFLGTYLRIVTEHDLLTPFLTEERISFSPSIVGAHRAELEPYLRAVQNLHTSMDLGDITELGDTQFEFTLGLFEEILDYSAWPLILYRWDQLTHDPVHRGEPPKNSREMRQLFLSAQEKHQIPPTATPRDLANIDALLFHTHHYLEELHRDIIMADTDLSLEGRPLPAVVQGRQGLERQVLTWLLTLISHSQRQSLMEELERSPSDEDSLRLLGVAAHLEKLLQLASYHPAVPRNYQAQFTIFQRHVPPRDRIDAGRTLALSVPDEVSKALELDWERPLNEGTIGGVYQARLHGRPIVLKVIPEGKLKAIQDSLRIVAGVRRYLWASRYQEPGARALDEFLAFYERSLPDELNLLKEYDHVAAFNPILPEGFLTPVYIDDLASPLTAGMEMLPSRPLHTLDPEQSAMVVTRVEHELFPAMIASGHVHYDLHPGNLGYQEPDRIVLYDMGRVLHLSQVEQAKLMEFYTLVTNTDTAPSPDHLSALKGLLTQMGTITDQAAFERIDEPLALLLSQEDPLKALESLFPHFPDYGYVLHDSYVKLLLSYISWEGSRTVLRSNQQP